MTTAESRDNSAWDPFDSGVAQYMRRTVFDAADRLDRSALGKFDSISGTPALMRAAWSLSTQPMTLMKVTTDYYSGAVAASLQAFSLVFGSRPESVKTQRDKRFGDVAWADNPAFFWLRAQYDLMVRAAHDLLDAADMPERERTKARFVVQSVLDAIAPTNFVLTNPAVVKKAIDTGGLSLVRGFRNFAADVATNNGQPRQVASGVHEVGRNLAVTPGKVVFRNELMELIQYTPTTKTVYETPLLFSPPWINRYYIMDLAPGRSLVEWAVQHGHTVFLISYRNPDSSMKDVQMDDYLISGPKAALDVITDITGSHKVNLLGLCLGGTLTMATLAYLDATGDDRVNCATFLNTLLDFSDPGPLSVFTDESAVRKLEKTMSKTGFLPGENMRKTFDALRANDLIWNYVVRNWLMGEDPPAFDILTWNTDSTRMPAAMHSFYLRSCYIENQLARGVMTLAGQQLDPEKVDQDLYFLAAEQDHIAPWRSSYEGARLTAGQVRFVLSNSGHIAGIVNPPSPKSRHYVGPDGVLPASPDQWLTQATMHPTTWWVDWASWIGQRAGARRTPPKLGSDRYPPLTDAPGTYVLA